MSNRTTEDIISALYDMVQDARSVPLSADKCIVERDREEYEWNLYLYRIIQRT